MNPPRFPFPLRSTVGSPRRLVRLVPWFFAAIVAGCLSNTLERSKLPADWIATLPRPGTTTSLAGEFVVTGEYLDESFARRGVRGRRRLTQLLFSPDDQPRPGDTIILQFPEPGKLVLVIRDAGRDVDNRTISASTDSETGAVVVKVYDTGGSGGKAAAYASGATVSLWRGSDGSLIARRTTAAVGVAFLVPYVGVGEQWARWFPATPERLAAHARQAETLRPLKLGDPLPAFEAVDHRGERLSPDSLRGQVVLFQSWSTIRKPVVQLRSIAAIYEKYRDRGLVVVTLWDNDASDREAVIRYIAEHRLAWRHHLKSDPGPNEISRAIRIKLVPGMMMLMDREGRLAAVKLSGAALDPAVARLFPAGDAPAPTP